MHTSRTSCSPAAATPRPKSRAGRRMTVAGALLTGGMALGSLFSPLGVVGAQETDAASTQPDSLGEAAGNRFGPGRHGHGDLALLQELLGVSAEELGQAKADGKTLAEFATEQGVSVDALVSAMVDHAANRIAEAVEAGNLEADRAATMTANLEERITERVNRAPGEGRVGWGGPRRHGPWGHGHGLSALSDLGLDVDVLREAMREGATLGEAAAAQGVSEADLLAALVDEAEARLADAVENGRLDAERAAEIEARIGERAQDRVDGGHPEGRRVRGGSHGGGPLTEDSSFES